MNLTPAKVTMLMLLAVAALIGLYVAKRLFAVDKPVARTPNVNIPLAAADLAPGTRITRDHIGFGPYPEKEMQQDTLRSERVIVGRVVKDAVKAGEPLQGSQLYEPGENAPLKVSEGKQALALEVKNSTDMVDGLIKPENFVDLHFVLNTEGGSIDSRIARLGGVSVTLLKGVKVLAMNRTMRQSPVLTTGNSVTLELTPAQTNIVLVAQGKGDLSLSYNPTGEGDGGVALNNADRATLWEILGLKKPASPKDPAEPEKPFETEEIRGTGSSITMWDKKGKKWTGGGDRFGDHSGDRNGWSSGSGVPGWGPSWYGGHNDTYNHDNSYDNRDRSGGDYFDPADVFESPGAGSGPGANNEPSARRIHSDSDIPMTSPGVNPIRPLRRSVRLTAPEPTALRR